MYCHGVCFVGDGIAIAKHVLNNALFFLLNILKLLNTAVCMYVCEDVRNGCIHK